MDAKNSYSRFILNVPFDRKYHTLFKQKIVDLIKNMHRDNFILSVCMTFNLLNLFT